MSCCLVHFTVLVNAFMIKRLFICNVCFTYFTYCMYTVVGTVESLVVLLPYIILYAHHVAVVYMKYDTNVYEVRYECELVVTSKMYFVK